MPVPERVTSITVAVRIEIAEIMSQKGQFACSHCEFATNRIGQSENKDDWQFLTAISKAPFSM